MELHNEKVLLCDMDGVMADSVGRAFEIIKQEQRINMCHSDVVDYWFNYLPVRPHEVLDVMRRPGFYTELDVITGAIPAINRLRENYDVRVCTAPMRGAQHCENEKREWLWRHFDKDFADKAYVVEDKTKVPGHVLIDDNPDISTTAEWIPVLFDQAWNRHNKELPRMLGWSNLGVVDAILLGFTTYRR